MKAIMRRHTWLLSEKAILAVIVILLPVLITFLLVYNQNKTHWKERILQETTFIAETYEGQAYQFLEMNKRRVQDFASDGFVRTQLFMITHGRTSLSDVLSKHLIKNKIVLDKTINAIYVLSTEGKVVASTNRVEIGRDFSREPFFVKGKDAVEVVETYARHTTVPELAISAPVFMRNTHKAIGVMVKFVRISELNKVLSGEYAKELGAISWAKGRWKTLEVYLVNREKLMITTSLFVKDAILRQVVDTPPVNACLMHNKEMAGFYKDYRGIEVIGASMNIPSLHWVLLAEIDKVEALAAVKSMLINAIITGAVIIIMVILLLVAFLKKVVRPIRTVSDASENVARGNLDVHVQVQSHDEIGMLCESFNYMTLQIKDRSAALLKSESRLSEAQRIAHLGNWEWDIEKNELNGSDEAYRIFGFTLEKSGMTCGEFLNKVHLDDQMLVKKAIQDALYKKNSYNLDHRIKINDTTERYVHEKAEISFDDRGRAVRMIGTVQDVTERKQMEEELRLLKTIILAIIESNDIHAALGIVLRKVCEATGWLYGEAWVPSADGTHLEISTAWYSKMKGMGKFRKASECFEFPPGIGLPGRAWAEKKPVWIPDVTIDTNFPRASIAREYGLKAAMSIPVFTADTVVAVMDFFVFEPHLEDERLVGLVSAIAAQLGVVIQRKQLEETIRQMAYYDTLTTLPNRVLFHDRLNLSLIHAQRHKQKFAVMFLDLDRFKVINDTLGHATGDQLLKEVADRLRKCVRGGDTVSRLGGDEFTLLLPEIGHEENAARIAQIISEAIRQPMTLNNSKIQITTSIGIALYPDNGNEIKTLLRNADIAMYHAKKAGRNKYKFYNQAMSEKAEEQR